MVGAEFIWELAHFGATPGGATARLLYFKTTSGLTAQALRLHLFGENILEDELETFGGMRPLHSTHLWHPREMSLTYTSECSYKTPIKDKKFFLWERGCRACVGSYTTLWYGRKGKEAGKYQCRWWAESGSKGRCSVWKRESTALYDLPPQPPRKWKWKEGDKNKEVRFDEHCPPEGDEEGGAHH